MKNEKCRIKKSQCLNTGNGVSKNVGKNFGWGKKNQILERIFSGIFSKPPFPGFKYCDFFILHCSFFIFFVMVFLLTPFHLFIDLLRFYYLLLFIFLNITFYL